MKKLVLLLALVLFFAGCSGQGNQVNTGKTEEANKVEKEQENTAKEEKTEEKVEEKQEEKQEEKKEEKQEPKEEPKQEEKKEESPVMDAPKEEAIDLSGAYMEPGVNYDDRNEETRSKALELNRWLRTGLYSTQSKADEEIYLRIKKVTPQSENAEILKEKVELNNKFRSGLGSYNLDEMKVPADVELCLVEYEVYVPKNFPMGEYGMSAPVPSLEISSIKGGGIPSQDGTSTYIGMGTVYKLVQNDEYKDYRGQVYTGYGFFAMVKEFKDYVIEVSSRPIGDTSDGARLLFHSMKPF